MTLTILIGKGKQQNDVVGVKTLPLGTVVKLKADRTVALMRKH